MRLTILIILAVAVAACLYLANWGPVRWKPRARIATTLLGVILGALSTATLIDITGEMHTRRDRIREAEQVCMRWGDFALRRQPTTVEGYVQDLSNKEHALHECNVALGRIDP